MADYKKLGIVTFPRDGPKVTSDTLYWKRLNFPVAVKDYGPINYVDFSSEQPNYFAVTCSSRVQIYNPITNEVCGSLTRFKKTAYGGTFRDDGQLLIAGSDDGFIQLYHVKTKALLRVFKGHKAPTHRCKFTTDGTHILSFSDDDTVCIWDMPTETKLLTYAEHKDYVRAGAVTQASQDIFISGSYDHTIKMYDSRTPSSIMSLDHGDPVESVIMFPTGGVFLSAGGTNVKVWDAVAGRLLAQMTQHHKTVTCLQFASEGRRLMSGSLDRHVKIYDVSSYQVVHSLDYPSPILSLAVAPEDKVVVAGMSDGLISIRHQKQDKEHQEPKKKQRKSHFYNNRLYDTDFQAAEGDVIVPEAKSKKLKDYDQYLRTFQSSRALDAVLRNYVQSKNPEVTISVMRELIRRGAIRSALAGRKAKSLKPLVKFASKHIRNVKFVRVLKDILHMLADIYGSKFHDPEIKLIFEDLLGSLKIHYEYEKKLSECHGILKAIIAAGNVHRLPQESTLNDDKVLTPTETAQKFKIT